MGSAAEYVALSGEKQEQRGDRRSGVCPGTAAVQSGSEAGAGAARERARHRQLLAAVGEIDCDGGEGGASGVYPSGEFDPGAGPEPAAERGICAQGEGVRAAAWVEGEGRRGERGLDR